MTRKKQSPGQALAKLRWDKKETEKAPKNAKKSPKTSPKKSK
jgi:hypothetical protein